MRLITPFLTFLWLILPLQVLGQVFLRAADVHPSQYPTAQSVIYMGKRIAEMSNNDLVMKHYAAAQLGQEKDTILATIFGAIDINRINVAPLGNIAQELQVLSLPYLFRDQDHMYSVLEGEIGEQLLDYLTPHHLVGLAFLDSGARSFYTKKPINKLSDMKGLKIRVQNTDMFVRMMDALGANATPMSFGQVYESLLTGVIDGAENNWPSYVSTRHFEAAKYYTLDRHSMVPEVIVMSEESWNKLSKEHQFIVKKAAKEASKHMRVIWNERVNKAKAQAIQAGIIINENIELDEFVRAVEPLYQDVMQDPELADLITKIREAR
ncbi:TRAP transporter substrate-binding protein [Paraglaciecola marina]|uniref:TRAP transporter substrate-binding protein n=1 Tax=Paraglaciecola marina TaxID=2500157 RepID=UPI00105E1B64|nr:TRAP transporter substrate-binding protein [Paraglaciecola marina]